MLRTKVLHKHKKLCFVLPITMERDHGIKPGTLFRSNGVNWLMKLTGNVDKDKIVSSPPAQGYLKHVPVYEGDMLMFIDVVYDPYVKHHFLRFLHDSKIVGLRHTKGKTLASLKKDFEKLDLEEVEPEDG